MSDSLTASTLPEKQVLREGPIWVTGAGGLIGHHVVKQCPGNRQVIGWLRRDLDLLDFGAVERQFKDRAPAAVIHCAGMSKSPQCEAQPKEAQAINVDATRHLAQLAHSIPLIFLSTDLVFDGQKGHYAENEPPHPLNTYARTKWEAEAVVAGNPHHTIVRTSLNGGISPTGDRGFNEQIQAALRKGTPIPLFVDEFRSPLAATVMARALWEMLEKGLRGLYHLCGSQRLSRHAIGVLLNDRWGHDPSLIQATSLASYQGPPRAPDTTLDCSKLQSMLSFPLPSFETWLRDHPECLF